MIQLKRYEERMDATKVFALNDEHGRPLYHIKRGKSIIAEFVRASVVDRLVDGYNLLNRTEIDQENEKRIKRNFRCTPKLVTNTSEVAKVNRVEYVEPKKEIKATRKQKPKLLGNEIRYTVSKGVYEYGQSIKK